MGFIQSKHGEDCAFLLLFRTLTLLQTALSRTLSSCSNPLFKFASSSNNTHP